MYVYYSRLVSQKTKFAATICIMTLHSIFEIMVKFAIENIILNTGGLFLNLFEMAVLGFILYIAIFYAIKHGINYSEIGRLIQKKYPDEEKTTPSSNEEIEKELETEIEK